MRRGRKGRYGTLLFFVPILVILVGVLLGFAWGYSNSNGTLVIMARSSGAYTPVANLTAPFQFSTRAGVTPATYSLPAGTYTIAFGGVQWYATPAPLTVSVEGGNTAYAAGVYTPLTAGIGVTDSGFNTTRVLALHSVTPVIWVNRTNQVVTLEGAGIGRVSLQPGSNLTHIFGASGTYAFDVFGTQYYGEVSVG